MIFCRGQKQFAQVVQINGVTTSEFAPSARKIASNMKIVKAGLFPAIQSNPAARFYRRAKIFARDFSNHPAAVAENFFAVRRQKKAARIAQRRKKKASARLQSPCQRFTAGVAKMSANTLSAIRVAEDGLVAFYSKSCAPSGKNFTRG